METGARVFEANTVFDTPDLRLRQARELLRLRECGGVVTVTWKGPPAEGPHKSREEVETTAGDAAAVRRLWERLGYQPVFRYEKYRTTFHEASRTGEAVLDETPIGCFVELEGPAAWIDENAQRMGYTADEYITSSYATLYLDECKRRGWIAGHMMFGEGDGEPG